jgi:hypothetical protein
MAKIPSSICNSLNCVIAEVLTQPDAGLAALELRQGKSPALKQGVMQQVIAGMTRRPLLIPISPYPQRNE